jgi:hypothetical protein
MRRLLIEPYKEISASHAGKELTHRILYACGQINQIAELHCVPFLFKFTPD